MEQYRMNRTVVAKSSFNEADDHVTYFKYKTPIERLNHACYIINSIFQVNQTSIVNRKVILSRKHV